MDECALDALHYEAPILTVISRKEIANNDK